MKKKTVRTIKNEWDEDRNLVKSTETIIEEVMHTGINPNVSPLGTGIKPFSPNNWNGLKIYETGIYTDSGSPPMTIRYDGAIYEKVPES